MHKNNNLSDRKTMKLFIRQTMLLAITAASAQYASAFDFENNGLFFNILNENQVEVASETDYDLVGNDETTSADPDNNPEAPQIVNIPRNVNHEGKEYTVTAIGKYAFYNSPVKAISMPETISRIGDHAFRQCKHLGSFEITPYITEIGIGAFAGSAIEEIKIPENVKTVGPNAFSECRQLTKVEFDLNSPIQSLEYNMFISCEALESVILPSHITSIGEYAFSGCKNLKDIKFINNETDIKEECFLNCASLTDINVRFKNVGEKAFSGCTGLKSISIKAEKIGKAAFQGCTDLVSATVDASHISDDAFNYCKSLKEFSTNASYIGNGVFGFSTLKILNITETGRVTSGLDEAVASISRPNDVIITVPDQISNDYLTEYPALFSDKVAIELKSDMSDVKFVVCQADQTDRAYFYEIPANSTLFPYRDSSISIGWDTTETASYEVRYGNETLNTDALREITSDGIADGGRFYRTPTLTSDATIFVGSKGAGINDTADVTPDRFDVFTTDGRCIGKAMTASETDKLPKGIYIVRAGNRSFKIAR